MNPIYIITRANYEIFLGKHYFNNLLTDLNIKAIMFSIYGELWSNETGVCFILFRSKKRNRSL